MLMFGSKRKKPPTKSDAMVFVDYEHWFYSYKNLFNMKPNFAEWLEEIQKEYQIQSVLVFGDFTEREIGYEVAKIEAVGGKVIHSIGSKDGVDKDFTDFIMLDYMYQAAVVEDSPEVVILFTGDGHFDSVIKYMREKLHKKVFVYGVKRAFSGKLKSASSSYVEMPRNIQQQQYYYQLILESLNHIGSKPDKYPTYWKTVRYVSEYNGVSEDRIQTALDELLDKKYIMENEVLPKQGMKTKILKVSWKKLIEDGIWKQATASIN